MSYPRLSRQRPHRALAVVALVLAVAPGRADEGRKCALLIGVGQYDNGLRRLRYAEHDVEELADTLVACGYDRQDVRVLTAGTDRTDARSSPTIANIRRALDALLAHRKPADSVLIAFAGHGVQFQSSPECYLCPVDAELDEDGRSTLLSLSQLYRRLGRCPAGVKLVLVDACRNDPRDDTANGGAQRAQPQESPAGIAVLYSCSKGQEALEDEKLQHGIFCHFLIEGLRGKAADPATGAITLGRLADYLANRVDDHARRYHGRPQRPSLFLGALRGPVVLARATIRGREVRRLVGHDRMVTSIAFCPDGKRVLSGSYDGSLRVWDLETGEDVACLRTEGMGWIRSVAVSPDGRFALSGGTDRRIRLWDLTNRTEVRQLRGHEDVVCSVAFAPDGRSAVSASKDRAVCLWDLDDGEPRRWLRGHDRAVWSVVFTPDGRSVLSASADETLRLWDVDSGKQRTIFRGHEDAVLSVAVSPDGHFAVSGGADHTLRLWDLHTGAEVRRFEGDMDRVLAVAFSPDGRRALCGGLDQAVQLWDVCTGRSLGVLRGHETGIRAVAFAPDGRHALSASGGFGADAEKDPCIRLWELP
jgi:hypothetical protein